MNERPTYQKRKTIMFVFECPSCGLHAEVADNESGRQIKCPKCESHIEIPRPDAKDEVPVAVTPAQEDARPPVEPEIVNS